MKKYLKSLIGFPIGNLMLAISYILIYVVDGEAKYISEIAKLTEFKYMLGQVIFSGIFYIVIMLTIQFIFELFADNGKNLSLKKLVKFFISLAITYGICTIISAVLNRRGSLKGYTGDIFAGISVICMVMVSVVYVIYQEIQNRKINQALKKKQANNN